MSRSPQTTDAILYISFCDVSLLAATGGIHQRMRRPAPNLARFREPNSLFERWRSALGIRVSWRRRSATVLPPNRRGRRLRLLISSSQPLATALNVQSAVFWTGQVLSVEPVFFCPTMTICQ